jgi:CRP/FNR family transcriptional regulator, cyclic AMP receptor protein
MSLPDIEVIRKLDFFEPLDNRIIKQIAQQCFDREFAAGDFIIRQGEPGLGLYFITEGKVRVQITDKGAVTPVAELQSGDCLGEFAIVDDKARSADVICLQNTKCLLLTRDSFSKLMSKYPEIAVQMVKALVARIRATNTRVSQAMPALVPKSESAPLVGPASNGTISPPQEVPGEIINFYNSSKGKVKDFLLNVFEPLYALKAITQFSMAVVGCPVRVEPENGGRPIFQASVHGVNVCLFPSGKNQTLRLRAFADGDVSATVLRPVRKSSQLSAFHLQGYVRRDETWRLHVPSRRGIWIEIPNGKAIGIRPSR